MRNRVIAEAQIVAERGPAGVTKLPVLRSQAPLALRRTPEAVYLVGAAAGPIAGDRLSLAITVGPGAFLRVQTSAACVALPGPDNANDPESLFAVTVDVGPGGRLEYLPEPTVVAARARHATEFRITLAAGAALLLRDELILGRHGESGGHARGVLSVDYAGRPLLRQALDVSGDDEASRGPAVLAGHRAVGTLLRAGEGNEAVARHAGSGGSGPRLTGYEVAGAGVARRTAAGLDAFGPGAAGSGASGTGAIASGAPGPEVPETGASETGVVGPGAAVMPLAGPGVLITALADDAVTLRRRLSVTGTLNSAGQML